MPSDRLLVKPAGILAASMLLAGLSQTACDRIRKVEGASPQAASQAAADAGQAGLFTVSAEQQAHLKVVPVERASWFNTIHTTGTVDWDADHTTQAITQVNDANTDVENSLQALRIFGITRDEIEQADKQGVAISPNLAVRSPIDGVVVQKLVSPGELIEAGTTACFAISDVSTVWVQGHIFDRDLPDVHSGDSVEETNPAFARSFRGEVSYVGASVDPATRTTPVRIVTHNPEGLVKRDMFVDAAIRTATRSNMLVVPVAALLHDEQNEPMVYVEASPGKYAKRLVQVGEQRNDQVEIRSGLQFGERVVSDGSLFVQFALTAQ